MPYADVVSQLRLAQHLQEPPRAGHHAAFTEEGQRIVVGSPAWFVWLQTATSFFYQPDNSVDRLTARKEKRRHQFYWFGYTRNASKLHNVYLGKSEQLTRVRLDQACAQLADKAMRGSGC